MSSVQRSRNSGRRTRTDAVELYKFARDEELRKLESQRSELDAMRQRTAQYLAFVGAATAFLAGSGLRAAQRDWLFYAIAAVASMLSVLMIWSCIRLFLGLEFPSNKKSRLSRPAPIIWAFTLKPGAVLAMIESDLPQPDETDLAKYVTSKYAEMSQANSAGLIKVRRMYVAALTLGASQVVGWTVLVWLRA